jgi:nucleoid DNA-binding protein
MEIALVYREIQQLLIKDENVILPKVGKFAIVAKSATFLEDCKIILPPKKELLFSASSEQGENDVFEPWQQDLAEEICSKLQQDGAFEVPGFGIFRQTEGGEISFEVSEEFDFAPDSFTLEAISLELNPDPAPMQEPEQMPEPVSEPVSEPEESDADAVPQVEPVMPANAYRNQKVLVWVLVAAVALLLIILFILLFKEQFAQMLRNLLYTEEELEIIRQWGAR